MLRGKTYPRNPGGPYEEIGAGRRSRAKHGLEKSTVNQLPFSKHDYTRKSKFFKSPPDHRPASLYDRTGDRNHFQLALRKWKERPIQIAQISATFPPYLGGTGNVCYQTARELAHRGHQVNVITPAQPGSLATEHYEGIKVHRISPIYSSGNAHLLPGLGLIKGIDLIHLHYPFYGGELVGMAARNHQTPLVITYHHDVVLYGWKGQIEKLLRWSIERWLLNSANVIIFTSEDYAQTSVIRPYLHNYEGRIAIIPNGVDPSYFYQGSELAIPRKFRHLPSNDFIILLVARLDQAHYFKGVEVLLCALTLLPSQVKALIVGDGDLRSHYEEISRELNLDARVIFTGTASQAELRGYYQFADLTILPSTTGGEAFGLVLLESLACGTPVIASDLPGVRTIVDDGQDGFLVKPGHAQHLADKVLFLYQDKHLAEEMGRRGRKKVEENYCWRKVIDRLEEVYYKVLDEKSGRASVPALLSG